MSTSRKNKNFYRLSTQIIIVLLLIYMVARSFADKSYLADYEAYCPFGGAQSLASFLQSHSLACSMTTVQIAMGIALLLGVVLFSKLFCSYICPLGTVTEWIGSFGRKMHLQITLKGLTDKLFRLLKYTLLFITVYFTVTSSELFCRKFDPYYVTFTGFAADTNLYYGIAALLLLIGGSFFIRQFWCKYICPLGAMTNLAVFALPTAALILSWVLLTGPFGLAIPWPWLLGAVCLTGFVLEATTLRYLVFPGLRITRSEAKCTHCRICDKHCPMGLEISTVDKVEHIDCHLCADCVVKCPEKGALTINKRNMTWLPLTATVVLIASALIFSSYVELPTISEHWGNAENTHIKRLEMSGLKNIKCFGSSRSFANHMKAIDGVTGVETFVKHHKVAVYYDSTVVSALDVKKAIFSPLMAIINFTKPESSELAVAHWGIEQCFDPNDQYYLMRKLSQNQGIMAISTQFGEPVLADIYFNPNQVNQQEIKEIIEQKKLIINNPDEQTTIQTAFTIARKGQSAGTVTMAEFLAKFFETQDITFNNYEAYKPDELKIFEIPFPQAAETAMQQFMPHLISHCSNDDGIVRFKTEYRQAGPVLMIWYVIKMTNPLKIKSLLNNKEMLLHYPDKHIEKIDNPFRFDN